jgi:16S rRNA (guanine966-N2)-methyltransferase
MMLERRGWLASRALIYIESERELRLDGLPATWARLRQGQAGEVAYGRYQRHSDHATT